MLHEYFTQSHNAVRICTDLCQLPEQLKFTGLWSSGYGTEDGLSTCRKSESAANFESLKRKPASDGRPF